MKVRAGCAYNKSSAPENVTISSRLLSEVGALNVSSMKLDFSRSGIAQLWIDGALPAMLKQTKGRDVRTELAGKSDSPFPPALMPVGDLLCSERPKPLQHAVTLLLSYPHSVTLAPAMQDDNGWWTMPGSTIYGQIRIPLPSQAIAQIRQMEGDGYQYELNLKDVELVNKTPRSRQ